MLEAELRGLVRSIDPVWPNAPRADSFGPIVLLLVLALPWIHLTAHAQMDAGLAAAGLRALDLLDGADERYSDALVVPPLPKWVQAVALTLPVADKPLALAAPAALFGLLSGVMLYLLGRVWYSPAVGVLAALLLTCNRTLLEQIRTGSPGPIVLFFTLASLWPFAEHLRRQDDVFSRWTLLGAVALAALFLAAPIYAASVVLLGFGAMLFRGGDEDDPRLARIRKALFDPTTRAGVVTLLLGGAFAAPWLAHAPWTPGAWAPWDPPDQLAGRALTGWHVISSAPVLVVLAAFGWVRSVQRLVQGRAASAQEVLPVLWTVLAAASFGFVDPNPAALLVLTAPMILLAACIVLDVALRRLDDRQVLWLATVVGVVMIWLGDGPLWSTSGAPPRPEWRVAGKVGGTLAVLVALTLLYRWSRNSDARRRTLLGAFIVAVLALACAPGLVLLRATPRIDDPWHQVQQRLAQLIAVEQPDVILFLDRKDAIPPVAGPGRDAVLEFLVRTLAPRQEPQFVAGPEDLEGRLAGYERPLIIAAQNGARLPKIYSIAHGSRILTLAERLDSDRVTVYSPLGPPKR